MSCAPDLLLGTVQVMSKHEVSDAQVNAAVEELTRRVEELMRESPLLDLFMSPDRQEFMFNYGDKELVLVGAEGPGLASTARAIGIARTRRRGRPGNRHWEITIKPAAELPKPASPGKRKFGTRWRRRATPLVAAGRLATGPAGG